jgi:hypothetical protein
VSIWKVPSSLYYENSSMFQPLKCHYQGVTMLIDTWTYVHTCNTSVHIQGEVMYEDSGVRREFVCCPRVRYLKCTQICIVWQKVWWPCFYDYINSQVCPLDLFVFTDLGLRNCYTHTQCVCVCVCVHAHALYVVWFRNSVQSSTVNKVIMVVDFYRCMHGICNF